MMVSIAMPNSRVLICQLLVVFATSRCWTESFSSLSPPATTTVGRYTTTQLFYKRQQQQQLIQTILFMSEARDDAWFSDYNPNDFVAVDSDRYSTPSSSYPPRRGGGGGGGDRGGGYDRRKGGGGDRGGGGGNRRSFNKDYERDTSMDNSNVDVTTVTTLLQDRVTARRDGDYDTADQIRAELLNVHGVQVWDKEMVWRSGCSAGGSGGRGGSGDRFSNDRREDRGRGPQRQRRPQQDFGPTGHDYEMTPDAGPIVADYTVDQINDQIAQRLQAKLSRRFDEADRIQSELAIAGVYVHDGRKEWRADGELFGNDDSNERGRPGRDRNSRSDRDTYSESIHSDSTTVTYSDEEKQEIQKLVTRRVRAKASRDYTTADNIREQLKSTYNVFIEDRLKEWSVNGDFGPDAPGMKADYFQPWSQSQYSQNDNNEVDETAILNLLDLRGVAKADRDYADADRIRDTLVEEYNVELNDRLREWSVGGNFGLPSKDRVSSSSFVRRGGGEISSEDIDIVMKLITERAVAKKKKDFNTADRIRDELEQVYSVKVDDKSREWRVITEDYALAQSNVKMNIDSVTLDAIQFLLKERNAYKADRNYEAADEIRDQLREEYSVSIDDRVREFTIIVDEFTVVDGDDSFGETEMTATRIPSPPPPSVTEETTWENETTSSETTESTSDAENDVELESCTVVQLKEMLRKAGLPVSGNKPELIERLRS